MSDLYLVAEVDMRIARIAFIVLAAYITIGLLFGGAIGYFQPQDSGTARLRTIDSDAQQHETVLRFVEDESGQIWLLSGQWFRGWFYRVLENPDIELVRNEKATAYHAVEITDPATLNEVIALRSERESVVSLWLGRALILFAPIKVLRLDSPEIDSPS